MSFPFCPMLYTPCLSMYSCIFNFVNFKPNYIVRYLPLCALWDISTLCFVRYFHFVPEIFALCDICPLWFVIYFRDVFTLCFVRHFQFVLCEIYPLCARDICFVRYFHFVLCEIFSLCAWDYCALWDICHNSVFFEPIFLHPPSRQRWNRVDAIIFVAIEQKIKAKKRQSY